MKRFLLWTLFFIITIYLFNSCSCERNTKEYSLPVEIYKSNTITDYVNNKHIRDIIYIGLNELQLDSININLLYLPNNFKFTYINGKAMLINALIIENFQNNYTIFINDKSVDSDLISIVLSHELIHLKQKYDKRLIVNYENGTVIFDEKLYFAIMWDYNERPWEIEAFNQQYELNYRITDKLKEYLIQP